VVERCMIVDSHRQGNAETGDDREVGNRHREKPSYHVPLSKWGHCIETACREGNWGVGGGGGAKCPVPGK